MFTKFTKEEKAVNFSVCQLIWYENSHHSKFQAKNMSPNWRYEVSNHSTVFLLNISVDAHDLKGINNSN